jgi:hypothetical protein
MSLQTFLASAANVSKLLWPVRKGDPKRGEYLRQSLGIGKDSPLQSRSLRNFLEHIDERVDAWVKATGGQMLADRLILPLSMKVVTIGEQEMSAENYFRRYDPDAKVVSVQGERFQITPIVDALSEIEKKANVLAANTLPSSPAPNPLPTKNPPGA